MVLGFLLTLRIGELGGEFERIRGRAPLASVFLLRELLLILVGEPTKFKYNFFKKQMGKYLLKIMLCEK